jgi:short-chain fatty acids transporter
VRLAGLARGPRGLVGLTALVACTLALFNWSFGLVCGALFARTAGQTAAARGWSLHYPLLCAAGYAGMMVWHGGLSGTAPLKAATMTDQIEVLGPELAAQVGPIPLEASLFGGLNLWVTLGLWVLAPLLFMALTPRDGSDPAPDPAPSVSEPVPEDSPATGWLERIERSRTITWLLALPLVGALALSLRGAGLAAIDLNMVNLGLWVLALILHGRPDRFVRACDAGVRACTGVILLFPLYGGIMGMLGGSGLSRALAAEFAAAGAGVFTLVTFLSAGLLNLAVPSGGGQWAVQGPVVMAAALAREVTPADAMLAIAYGDQWTNMLQPFWAAPLLAITGVRARDIVGYCALWLAVGGAWIAACLLATREAHGSQSRMRPALLVARQGLASGGWNGTGVGSIASPVSSPVVASVADVVSSASSSSSGLPSSQARGPMARTASRKESVRSMAVLQATRAGRGRWMRRRGRAGCRSVRTVGLSTRREAPYLTFGPGELRLASLSGTPGETGACTPQFRRSVAVPCTRRPVHGSGERALNENKSQ